MGKVGSQAKLIANIPEFAVLENLLLCLRLEQVRNDLIVSYLMDEIHIISLIVSQLSTC